ncbi:MAG: FAD-dependent thymidylate synthase [Eubacteriales bacterium]|nr:FAD-dependent thymidylate synthase [Eubacteriales bacterium]
MDKIEVCILNTAAVKEAEQNMVFAARLTQRGHEIKTLADLLALYQKTYKPAAIRGMSALPHPTIQKFAVITVAVVGASRRYLTQITRHQNEVKFMSASLQYSDYSGNADFVVPYEIMEASPGVQEFYLDSCRNIMGSYEKLCASGVGHDAAGYIAPQGMRNALVMSATPYQWKHMIGQRVCRRNTLETRYVMLKIWAALYELSPELFAASVTGPFCQRGGCAEGKMSCKAPLEKDKTPEQILAEDFPLLKKEDAIENKDA